MKRTIIIATSLALSALAARGEVPKGEIDLDTRMRAKVVETRRVPVALIFSATTKRTYVIPIQLGRKIDPAKTAVVVCDM